MLSCVRDAVFPEVKDRSRQHRVGAMRRQTLAEMVEVARTAGSDHRDVHGRGDGFQEREVIAIASAIPVHAGEQDLPRTTACRFRGPGHDVETSSAAATVRVDTPAVAIRLAACVDGDDDALTTKDVRPGVDEVG